MNRRRERGIILIFILFIVVCPGTVSAEKSADEPGSLYARSAVLMDADSGRVLFEKEGKKILPMASTTKIMTCIVALENMERDQTGTASENAAIQPKVRMGVREGEVYRLKDLLYAMMLESYNDSAVIIAEEIGGNVESFTKMMDDKAREIGCCNTHFVTPNGLDGEDDEGIHATTAEDLARIMRYCIQESPQKEQFLEITRTRNYQFTDVEGGRSYTCTNHNAFLDMMDGALSGKTGFTADAGYCYIGALQRDGRTFIAALLACGWPRHKEYKWSDMKTLMEYGLENYTYCNIPLETETRDIRVKNGFDREFPYEASCLVETKTDRDRKFIRLLIKPGERVRTEETYASDIQAPVDEGDVVGEVRYLIQDSVVYQDKIVTAAEAARKNYHSCLKVVLQVYGMQMRYGADRES